MGQMSKMTSSSRRQVQRGGGAYGGRQRKLVAVGVAMPSTRPPASRRAKRSKVEIIKEESDFLRHPLMEQLVTPATHIDEASMQLMKFHGSYQQDNRDMRKFGAVRECGKKPRYKISLFPSPQHPFFASTPHTHIPPGGTRRRRRQKRRNVGGGGVYINSSLAFSTQRKNASEM